MKKKAKYWWPWLVLVAIVFGALALLGVPKWPEQASDYAAWLQAVFSVAAILVAVILARIQHLQGIDRERMRAAQENYEQFAWVAEVVDHTMTFTLQLPEPGLTRVENLKRARQADFRVVDRAINALHQLGPQDVPNGYFLGTVWECIGYLEEVRGHGGLAFQYLNAATDLAWHETLDPMCTAMRKLKAASIKLSIDAEHYRVKHGLPS